MNKQIVWILVVSGTISLMILIWDFRPKPPALHPPDKTTIIGIDSEIVTNDAIKVGQGVYVPYGVIELVKQGTSFTNLMMYGHINVDFTNEYGVPKTNVIFFRHIYWIKNGEPKLGD